MLNSRYNLLMSNNTRNGLLSSFPVDNIRPFKLHWLNSAHLESLLPGSYWEKIYEIVMPEFCSKIHSQFLHETKKQALFEILGKSFVSKFFPQESIDPNITKPPFLTSEESIKLYDESVSWLNETIDQIMKEKSIYNHKKNTGSDDMNAYIMQTSQIFLNNFYKELAKKETEYLKSISTKKRNFRQPTLLPSHKPGTAVSSVLDQDLPDDVEAIYPYGPEMLIAPFPHCSSFQSEFIGLTLMNLCQQNKEEIIKITEEMIGRRLPISLRKLLWKNVLLESESPIYMTDINFEEIMKEKFSRTVTRGISELKMAREMETPVNELLEHLIVEQYERCPPLNKFSVDFQREAVKILNVLYAYDRSYDRHLMFWLFPLHFGLKDEIDDVPMNKTTFAYEIALYLNWLRNIYPPWVDIFDMAEQVIIRLANWNNKFCKHILKTAQKNVISQSKEFLGQILNLENLKTKDIKSSSNTRKKASNAMSKKITNLDGPELLKSPIIFIRKWIGEGFVSVLKNEAVLFIFDQLFMEKFSPLVFEDACLAVMLLLEIEFNKAEDHEMIKNVFLKSPFYLLTLDFIKAYNWIHKGGKLGEVPKMNRRQMYTITQPDITPEPTETVQYIILPDVAFTDIKLKLVLPFLPDETNSFARNINEELIFLTFTIYLDDENLLQLKTQKHPFLKKEIINNDYTITNNYRFDPDYVVPFNQVNVSHMVNKFKDGDTFNVLITVQYQNSVNDVITLGWCTVECFLEDEIGYDIPPLTSSQLMRAKQQPEDSKLKEYVLRLKPRRIRQEIPIISGNVPIDMKIIPDKILNSKDLLLDGSLLGIYIYNPDTNPTPPPSSPVAEIVEETMNEISQPPVIHPTIRYERKFQGPGKARPNDDSWVPFNSKNYEKMKPTLSSKAEPFCLYIDQIRFIPDNGTIIKVTGKFVQSGYDNDLPEILLYPDVETFPRSPTFRQSSRQVFNEKRNLLLQNSTSLILQVYTVLKTTLKITLVGTCVVPIFNEDGILLAGCYQKRLRNQSPDLGFVSTSALVPENIDNAPYVDCVSITFRLWPLTKNSVVKPDYRSGCYQSMECEPTDFEWDIFDLYKRDNMFPKDLRDVVRDIKYRENNLQFKDLPVTHSFMRTYIPYRFNEIKHLPENEKPLYLDTELMFHYRIEKGIHIKVEQVFGIQDEKLHFATAKVFRGRLTANIEPRNGKKYGTDEFIIFSELDPNSTMQNSKWNDLFQIIKPYFDKEALLIVQVWSINAIVKDNIFYHKETNQKIVKLTKDALVGWTAIELFKNGFVNTGKHLMPLFQNRIHLALLKRFQAKSIMSVLKNEEEFGELASSSIIIYLLDAHRSVETYPSTLPLYTEIIDSLNERKEAFYRFVNSENLGSQVYQEILAITKGMTVDETKGEDLLNIFYDLFANLVKKLLVSVPPKQPYLPILF